MYLIPFFFALGMTLTCWVIRNMCIFPTIWRRIIQPTLALTNINLMDSKGLKLYPREISTIIEKGCVIFKGMMTLKGTNIKPYLGWNVLEMHLARFWGCDSFFLYCTAEITETPYHPTSWFFDTYCIFSYSLNVNMSFFLWVVMQTILCKMY